VRFAVSHLLFCTQVGEQEACHADERQPVHAIFIFSPFAIAIGINIAFVAIVCFFVCCRR
jgi:hypothetical protein